MNVTETSRFITPVLKLRAPDGIYTKEYYGSYLGDVTFDGSNWGEHFFLVYQGEVDDTLREYLMSHSLFETVHTPKEGLTSFVFKLPEESKETVVKPFLEGKYSQVDRTYVEEQFPLTPGHRLYANRLTFDKDPALRDYWKEKIGVDLPENAEVWSKPQKKKEIYGYQEMNLGTTPSQAD